MAATHRSICRCVAENVQNRNWHQHPHNSTPEKTHQLLVRRQRLCWRNGLVKQIPASVRRKGPLRTKLHSLLEEIRRSVLWTHTQQGPSSTYKEWFRDPNDSCLLQCQNPDKAVKIEDPNSLAPDVISTPFTTDGYSSEGGPANIGVFVLKAGFDVLHLQVWCFEMFQQGW